MHPVEHDPHRVQPEQFRQPVRNPAGTRIREPSITSAYSEMAAARVGEDTGLNGLSGLAGSAACLYSLAANPWYGACTSISARSTPAILRSSRVSAPRTARHAAACSAWLRA